jgi:hypothetical protein
MRSNKELDLPPYNLEIEKTTKKLRKKKRDTQKNSNTMADNEGALVITCYLI